MTFGLPVLVKDIGVAAVPGSSFIGIRGMERGRCGLHLQEGGDTGCGGGEVGKAEGAEVTLRG